MKSELIGIYEQQYIRPYLDNNTIKHGKILYHAIVSSFQDISVFLTIEIIYINKKMVLSIVNIL